MVKPRDFRVPIMLSERELKAIDDWRFENRIATRSEAIRRLCQLGLSTNETIHQVHDMMQSGQSWVFHAIDAYGEATGREWEYDECLSPEAPEFLQNAAIAAGALGLGLTRLGRTTFDAMVLQKVADLEKALGKVRDEMPYQKLMDEIDMDFIARLQALMKVRREKREGSSDDHD